MPAQFAIQTDHSLTVDVVDAITELPVDGATVTFRVLDANGSAITGGTGSCAAVGGTPGRYRGTILNTISIASPQNIQVEVVVVSGSIKRTTRRPMQAVWGT